MERLNIWNGFPITVQGRDESYDAYFQMVLRNTVNILREENLKSVRCTISDKLKM